MTLRTSYYDGSTGLQAQLLDAFANGSALVVANNASLISGLQTAASAGQTTFTITLNVAFKPSALRQKGLLMQAFLDGISYQLATENIMGFECVPLLNTSDLSTLKVDLNFQFVTT